jgi:hypothetical protein
MSGKPKKRFFANHAKSSAMVVSLGIHAVLIVVALSYVAVTVIKKEDKQFEAKPVSRPKAPLKKLKVPVKMAKKKPKPKLRKNLVVKKVNRKVPQFTMPEIAGVQGGLGAMAGGDGVAGIGFSMPEIDFFGTKASGEKVVFVVHFGPATISAGGGGDGESPKYNPFSRMTGLTIRNRLDDLVQGLPEYTLFNIMAYYAGDAWAFQPNMMLATKANKQKVQDWMDPVNPLEGDYSHCFARKKGPFDNAVKAAKSTYPTLVDKNVPFYAPKWIYPYVVPKAQEQKYAPTAANGFMHWGRGVAWAILEQKADTIFVLTTNYIDGWKKQKGDGGVQSGKMTASLKKMCMDVYGPDKKTWPTINIVVLAKAGRDSSGANKVLYDQFGPIWKGFNSEGSIIDDITKYMTEDEEDLFKKYRSEYAND